MIGEMKRHVEMEATYKGTAYKVILFSGGYRCGYVNITDFPPMDYEAEVTCHGGITFVGGDPTVSDDDNDPSTWIGFDCIHYRDGLDIEAATTYWGGLIGDSFSNPGGHIWTASEVGEECRKIIDQLVELRRNKAQEITLQRDEIEKLLEVLDNQSDENDWFLDSDNITKVFTWNGDRKVYEGLEEHIHRMLRQA